MVKYIQKAVFFRGSDDVEVVNKLLADGFHVLCNVKETLGTLMFFEKAEGESDIFSLVDYSGDEEKYVDVESPKVKKTRKPRTKKVKVEEESEETTASIPETV